ncbi:hypothetical protein [Phytohabitans houttuyneae]|uniref:Uncharacterized protein n=1 Tax=Phytohabitans houttuyneae TaxID=1076126 RepID=A0A6V8KFK8_9ACTN|nr:hypothetical protein [Phytohabitans houttuyneae]GFJ82230.1 hypothetical protein Phou_064100 [Phytohabitans houttuyneae]
MNATLKGIRPIDYVLAGLLTAAGALLMYGYIAWDGTDLPHPPSSSSWAALPAFVLVTLPVLWRRRHVLAVIGVSAAATAAHVLAFGWVTRCGVVLPLSFALAYSVARFARGWKQHVAGLAGIGAMQLVMLVRDASIDTVAGALPLAIPLAALFYGAGLVVQNRVSKKQPAALTPAAHPAAV